MKVCDLIKQLQTYNESAEVYMATEEQEEVLGVEEVTANPDGIYLMAKAAHITAPTESIQRMLKNIEKIQTKPYEFSWDLDLSKDSRDLILSVCVDRPTRIQRILVLGDVGEWVLTSIVVGVHEQLIQPNGFRPQFPLVAFANHATDEHMTFDTMYTGQRFQMTLKTDKPNTGKLKVAIFGIQVKDE